MEGAIGVRLLFLALSAACSMLASAQSVTADTVATPDHWITVDTKEWAWYLNFTSQQKNAVRVIDERCLTQENNVAGAADYVDTEEQREKRRAIVVQGTNDVRSALDPSRYARWRYIRDGGRPVKPRPVTGVRTGFGVRLF